MLCEMAGLLELNPIVAAIHEPRWEEALRSPVCAIFLLKANLFSIKKIIQDARTANKKVFLHIDLAEGIGKDRTGISFLKQLGLDGIISTRSQLIKMGKEEGLFTIQRFFIVDSYSIENLVDTVATTRPDMIEVMPGVCPKVISGLTPTVSTPIIAGGLIESKSEVISALGAGAVGVSTGKSNLWYQ